VLTMITGCTHHRRKNSQALLTPYWEALKLLARPLDKVRDNAIIISTHQFSGLRLPPSQLKSNERPTHVPCTRSSALSCTRLIGVLYLGQRPPLRGRPLSLLHRPPQGTPGVAGVRPPYCPTPPLPPCRLFWLRSSGSLPVPARHLSSRRRT
jgi:hypothetical protein